MDGAADPPEDVEVEVDVEAGEAPAPPRPVDRWRKNTASGAVAAALALGLKQVFDPQRTDTVAIEQEAPSKPVEPETVEVRFDPGSSSGTVVVVRPPAEP